MSPEKQKRFLDALTWYLEIMRTQRDELRAYGKANPADRGLGNPDDHGHFARVAIWYATLYAVYEGWCELGIEDKDVDLLSISHPDLIEKLKLFRNKTFHVHHTYPSPKHLALINDDNSVSFAYALTDALTWAIGRAKKTLTAPA